MPSWLEDSRIAFHSECIGPNGPITVSPGKVKLAEAKRLFDLRHASTALPLLGPSPAYPNGTKTTQVSVLSNGDTGSGISLAVAAEMSRLISLKAGPVREVASKPSGQGSGSSFEKAVCNFIGRSFKQFSHLRAGTFVCQRGGDISEYDQYSHLEILKQIADKEDELKTVLGSHNDYLINPDIVIFREREPDANINSGPNSPLVSTDIAQLSPLRTSNGDLPTLHASISCKLTMRSDRAQNSRSEALNLVRNRKGKLPHIVAVTAEPKPSIIASLALGTGDLDCVYHFALTELREALDNLNLHDGLDLIDTMITGQRLRDISDLPLDLVI